MKRYHYQIALRQSIESKLSAAVQATETPAMLQARKDYEADAMDPK